MMTTYPIRKGWQAIYFSWFDDEGDWGNGGGHFHYSFELQQWLPEKVTKRRFRKDKIRAAGFYHSGPKYMFGRDAPNQKEFDSALKSMKEHARLVDKSKQTQ